jgi:putative membrane protein
MYVIMRARSGAALAVMDLIVIEEWADILIPEYLCYLLICVLLGGVFSYFFTIAVGKIFAKRFANIPYALLVKLTISLVTILVFLFTGLMGLLILLIALFIGLLPVEFGVRRSHCMGILLIPVILYYI